MGKYLNMAKLTICFETNFEEAALRKSAKYDHIVQQANAKGYRAKLITLQVGSRGIPDMSGFQELASLINLPKRVLVKVLVDVARLALAGSFNIWCARNRKP